jgi:hypothetical protein
MAKFESIETILKLFESMPEKTHNCVPDLAAMWL